MIFTGAALLYAVTKLMRSRTDWNVWLKRVISPVCATHETVCEVPE